MLSIHFLNDRTGNINIGNYKWVVEINQKILAEGGLKGHNRLTGWEGLVKQFAREISKK